MLKLSNLTLPVGHGPEALRRKAAAALGIRPGAVEELTILRQSIDARKKSDVRWVYTVAVRTVNEARLAGRKGVSLYAPQDYVQPAAGRAFPQFCAAAASLRKFRGSTKNEKSRRPEAAALSLCVWSFS